MRPTVLFCLLVFSGSLLHLQCQTICEKDQYTIVTSDGSFLRCLNCDTCPPGRGLYPPCGSHVQYPPIDIECKDCPSGKFSDEYDSAPCHSCQQCAKHEIVAVPCTSSSDRICNGTCEKGYFFSKKASHDCQQCSYCCLDRKDEEQPECIKQGLNATGRHCSARLYKQCGPHTTAEVTTKETTVTHLPPTTHPSSTNCQNTTAPPPAKHHHHSSTTMIVLSVLSGLFLSAVVVGAILYKRKSQIWRRKMIERNLPNMETNVPVDTLDRSPTKENENVVSQDAVSLLNSSPTGEPLHPCVSKLNPGYVPSNPGTPRVSPNVTPHHTDDELDAVSDHSNRPRKFKRQKSHDSQNSKGQIKIVQQPESQNQKEGSRVEFKCNCKVQGKYEVWYQWFKDGTGGTELQEQNNYSLVLDPVRMRDFGCYICQVTCKGGDREAMTSDTAILEVVPGDGMRLKYLREVSLETQDEIAIRLENKTHGLGGWRQVAAKYGMKEHQIGALANAQQPGQQVMDFLRASKPDLTVYSFCKTLKEDYEAV